MPTISCKANICASLCHCEGLPEAINNQRIPDIRDSMPLDCFANARNDEENLPPRGLPHTNPIESVRDMGQGLQTFICKPQKHRFNAKRQNLCKSN